MEETLTLKKIDGEINVVTIVETYAPLSVEELDRQITETEARLEQLLKTRKAVSEFGLSKRTSEEVNVSEVVL